MVTLSTQAKRRGNITWGMAKKPYRLKLNKKASILGIKEAKNWVLLANYSDKSLLRTSLAFKIGQTIGADFTNNFRPVELVLDNEYMGSYVLTEQVEVHKNRVNITELDENDESSEKITGGYLLEFDGRLDEDFWFKTKKGAPITIKSPDEITPKQLEYISGYFQAFEDAVFSENFADPKEGYAKYINSDSFITWYLVQELLKNNDANLASSIFYHKNRNEKLGMGPLWDFDISAGNINYNGNDNPKGWLIRSSGYFEKLFQDPAFNKKFIQKWTEFKKDVPALDKFIDEQKEYLAYSQYENFKKWDILNTYVWPNAIVTGSYNKEVEYLRKWLHQRISWMDTEINKY